MDSSIISWEQDMLAAQERAQRERKFILVDFSKDR